MTPGPGLRKCTEYLSPGPGGMPLALRLSDWLGLTRLCTARHAAIPLLAPRPGLAAPRCRRWRFRISSRRAPAVAEKANAGPGGPMNWLTIIAAYAVRYSDLVRWLQVIVFARRGTVFRTRLAFYSRCPCSSVGAAVNPPLFAGEVAVLQTVSGGRCELSARMQQGPDRGLVAFHAET